MNKILLIIYASFIGLMMFQNCAQNGFSTMSESSDLNSLGDVNAETGICGSAQGAYMPVDVRFRETLCFSGEPIPKNPIFPEQGQNISYKCQGRDQSANCFASRAAVPGSVLNGECGVGQGSYDGSETQFRLPLCARGTSSPVAPSMPSPGSNNSYLCLGINGGSSVTCPVNRTSGNSLINGSCGDAQGSYLATALTYRTPLCLGGTASPLNPSFPSVGASQTYNCVGSQGGSTVSCTMTRNNTDTGPQNAVCGSAQGTYAYTDTSFRTPFCGVGAVDGTPGFPAQGGQLTYKCKGINNGTDVNCNASRGNAPAGETVNGECGSGSGDYLFADSGFRTPLCGKGTQTPSQINFPAAGSSVAYSCAGINSGTTASCSVNHKSAADSCTLPNYMYYNASSQLTCGTCTSDSSYHSDTKRCVNHNFAAGISNFNSDVQHFRADFTIDLESEDIADGMKEWGFLAAYHKDWGWMLYDGNETQADKRWKAWPANTVGFALPNTPTSFPYLMWSLPEQDVTKLGGWQIKCGYGKGNTIQEAFNEMLSGHGPGLTARTSEMININTQVFYAEVLGVPTTQSFNAATYTFDFRVNPAANEYGTAGYYYYAFYFVPKDNFGLGNPAEGFYAILDRSGHWLRIRNNGSQWVAVETRDKDNNLIVADGYIPYSASVETMIGSKNFVKRFPDLSRTDVAQWRGFTLFTGYAMSIQELATNLATGRNISPLVTIPKCADPSKFTWDCN